MVIVIVIELTRKWVLYELNIDHEKETFIQQRILRLKMVALETAFNATIRVGKKTKHRELIN